MRIAKFIFLHACFWIAISYLIGQLYPLIELEVTVVNGVETEYLMQTHPYNHLVLVFLFAIFFYSHTYYYFPQKFLRALKGQYIGLLTASILLMTLFQYQLDLFFIGKLALPEDAGLGVVNGYFVDKVGFTFTGILFFNAVIFTLGYSFFTSWNKDQKLKKQILEDKIRAENEMLRAQVNPHFLFNTLNTFFSMAQEHGATEIEEGVATLSDMFRYTLENNQMEQVELEEELNYLSAYVYLQNLRFKDGENVEIVFEVTGNPKGRKIHQMLLINFMENAFKHGIAPSRKSFVHITITIEEVFRMTIANSINRSIRESESYGVGLRNVKHRLDLLYPERHSLDISTDDTLYQIDLTLQL